MSDDMQAALREMAEKIGGLQSTVANLVQTWQSQEASAALGRREIREKVEGLRLDLQRVGGQVTGALNDIAAIKPSVQAFEEAKSQAIGAQKLGKGIWAILVFLGLGTGSGLTWILANWISIGPKPPLH